MKKKSLILLFGILGILISGNFVLGLTPGASNSMCLQNEEFNNFIDAAQLTNLGSECYEEFVSDPPTLSKPYLYSFSLDSWNGEMVPSSWFYDFSDCYPVAYSEMGVNGSMVDVTVDCAVSYYVGEFPKGCVSVDMGSKDIDTDGDGWMDRTIEFPEISFSSSGSSCHFIVGGHTLPGGTLVTETIGGVCDGRGNCCDTPIYIDADGDGVGHDGASSSYPDGFWCGDDYAYTGLSLPPGYSYTSGDCADDDPTQTVCSENSYGDSSCGDGVDNDGDGLTDCEEPSCEDFICDISSYGTIYCASDGTCSDFVPFSTSSSDSSSDYTPSTDSGSLITATDLIDAYNLMILMPESAYAEEYHELYDLWRHPVTTGVVNDAYELYYYGIMDIYELNDILKEWISS